MIRFELLNIICIKRSLECPWVEFGEVVYRGHNSLACSSIWWLNEHSVFYHVECNHLKEARLDKGLSDFQFIYTPAQYVFDLVIENDTDASLYRLHHPDAKTKE